LDFGSSVSVARPGGPEGIDHVGIDRAVEALLAEIGQFDHEGAGVALAAEAGPIVDALALFGLGLDWRRLSGFRCGCRLLGCLYLELGTAAPDLH
jgi:hypothetical protein